MSAMQDALVVVRQRLSKMWRKKVRSFVSFEEGLIPAVADAPSLKVEGGCFC